MVFISLLIAPVALAVANLAARRLGPSAAGWIAALPAGLAVAVAAVAVDAGGHAAWAMALSAAAHVPAQAVFALAFAAALTRRGLLVGGAAGALAYLAASLALAGVPPLLAVAAAIAAPAIASRRMGSARPRAASPGGWTATALTCSVPMLLVGGALVVNRLAGPAIAGAVAAFPTVSTTLVVAVVARDGRRAGAHALLGLVRSLPCYLTFCLLVVLALPALGLPAIALALAGCLTAGGLTWRRVPLAIPAAGPRTPAASSTRP